MKDSVMLFLFFIMVIEVLWIGTNLMNIDELVKIGVIEGLSDYEAYNIPIGHD